MSPPSLYVGAPTPSLYRAMIVEPHTLRNPQARLEELQDWLRKGVVENVCIKTQDGKVIQVDDAGLERMLQRLRAGSVMRYRLRRCVRKAIG